MEAAQVHESGSRRVGRDAWKASQRPRILDAITDLVAERGYPNTTVREIARRAGVSLSTFYEHFADKEQCFLSAYDRVTDQVFAAIAAGIRHAATPREALDAGIAAYFTWGAEHPSATATFVVEVHTAGPAALARRAAIIDRFRQLLAQAPRVANQRRKRATKLPSAAVDAVAYTLDSMSHDLVRQQRAHELPGRIPEAQEIARHILRI